MLLFSVCNFNKLLKSITYLLFTAVYNSIYFCGLIVYKICLLAKKRFTQFSSTTQKQTYPQG